MRVQQENKATWNDARSLDDADFYTIGYTGRNRDDLLERLRDAQVATLVDVRANPVSMYRPEFSKGKLQQFLAAHGIEYVHAGHLGVPRDIRALAIDHGRGAIWDWYDVNVAEPIVGNNLHWFFNALEHPIALMCTELDPTACHRHRLSLALERWQLKGFDL